MGNLAKYAEDAVGNVGLTVLLGPISIPAGQFVELSKLTVTQRTTGANALFKLELSNDGFAANVVPIARTELAGVGKDEIDLKGQVEIGAQSATRSIRVRYQQSALGAVSALLLGSTSGADITDVP